ncbi:MAG: glycosyltransferase [Planctomycetes bacterium]|nr:glycosyltransferase [Planctomycetota bacterium]
MHVLFVHRNFPAQFGQIAGSLAARGWRCTFVNEKQEGEVAGIRLLRYTPRGGATAQTHFFSRTFENAVAHAEGVYRALEAHPEFRPDVVVGHSGFGSTALLPELWPVPVVNYFEYFYRTGGADVDTRPEFPADRDASLRAHMRNAMILVDLHTCVAGYSPTAWQGSRFPAEYLPKIETIHDGIDTEFWSRRAAPRRVMGRDVPEGTRIVTYVARGFESMRGFDVFLAVAQRILAARKDVIVVAVGEDRVCYGGDLAHTGGKSFLAWCLERTPCDMDRLLFPGRLPPDDLANLLSISDVHVYLTVPFVLSWSMLNAMSCGAVLVASDTAPVQEFVRHGENGLLAGFSDVDELSARALEVIDDPRAFRALGDAARRTVEERASLAGSLPRLTALFEGAAAKGSG